LRAKRADDGPQATRSTRTARALQIDRATGARRLEDRVARGVAADPAQLLTCELDVRIAAEQADDLDRRSRPIVLLAGEQRVDCSCDDLGDVRRDLAQRRGE